MEQLKFRVWDNVSYMSFPFTLYDLQSKEISFTRDCPVMQYTGLDDENGQEIYTGDLFGGFGEGIKYFEVRKENGEIVLYNNYGKWGTLNRFFEVCKDFYIKVVVIGNVYQNPKLIKN